MTKIRVQLFSLIFTILAMGTLFFIAKSPTQVKYDAKDVLPATLYRSNAEPLNALLEQTWHPADEQIMETFDNRDRNDKSNKSDEQILKLPLIQVPHSDEPLTIALDYSGQNTTDQKQQHFKFDNIVITTATSCPTESPCSQAENQTLGTTQLSLSAEYVDMTKMSDKNLFEYGGWLQSEKEKKRFIYHQIFTVHIPNPTAQFELHLSTPKGIRTDYLKVTIAQGNISYNKPSAFIRIFGGKTPQTLRYVFTFLMFCVPIIFVQLYKKFKEVPNDGPKVFASLLTAWGIFLFVLGWYGIYGVPINFHIILGALIACAGTLMLFRIYFGLIVLILATIFAWLIASQFSINPKDLFMRTGMITFVTAYAYFSSVRSQLD